MTIRLHFLVEGQTEFNFVNQILKHHIGKTALSMSISKLTTKRDEKMGRKFSGGASSYEKLKNEISLSATEADPASRVIQSNHEGACLG